MPTMHRFPYINRYVNDVFAKETSHWDFVFLRPLLLVAYFFIRTLLFPFKFVFHRVPYGFEAYAIDKTMTWGMKHLAKTDAAELFLRHVQIEPILYRHVLQRQNADPPTEIKKLNGIDGDFSVENLPTAVQNNMTIGHDLLSYELVDRFDKQAFLDNLDYIRSQRPLDHEQFSKEALNENREHSWQVLGATNIVLLIVTTITVFGDLKTTMSALNSFSSDSILLWCLKRIYASDQEIQVDLDFFMQEVSNRGHYHSSAFFSNPSQYLYYHIVFDEVVYDMLCNRPPSTQQ
ncbi:hypothetical protein RISK_006055 [Rhodopirellula islandica]|uniref:Transmembrane protein n=1 Tax=Rhodopirellula islandica TaxID=595434 RepID=A0A0J1B5X1_RHOIS|nr:hypothetical protein [Rhodopirellula islandica]KLU01871.1 hypothetical protein RISK_006055 [Rhodopirellula islandica]